MSNPSPGPGRTRGGQGRVSHEGQGPGHDHPDGGGGLVGFGAEFGQGVGPLAGAGREQDPLRDLRFGAGHPGRDGAQVVAGQGGGTEVAAQVVRGLGRPERAVLDALLGHGERERVRAADRGGRVLAALDRRPAEGGGHAADVLRVEHVHPALLGADRAGQVVDVGLGGGGDDRAGVAQDDIGQERGLVGPGRGHDQQVLFQRDVQAVAVVRPAHEHRVLTRVWRSGTTAAALGRIRPERRRAARRPQRSHRLKTWAKPLPGCSRRCSRMRRWRARLPGR